MKWLIIIGIAVVYTIILSLCKAAAKGDRMEIDRVKEIEIRLNKLYEELGGSNDRMRIVEEMDRLENEKSLMLMTKNKGWNGSFQCLLN